MTLRQREGRGNRRWLWILCSGAFLAQTALHLVRPVTSYKVLDLDGSASMIGLLTAVYAILPVLIAARVGRHSDSTTSLARWIVAGLGIMGTGSVLLTVARDTGLMFLGTGILGVGQLVVTVFIQAVIARRSAAGSLEAGFGWFTAANSAGQMIGPLLGGGIVDTAAVGPATDLALLIGTFFALAAVPVILLGRHEFHLTDSHRGSPPSAQSKQSTWSLLCMPGVAPILYCSLGFVALVDILTAFMPLIGDEVGVEPAAVGALLALRGAASMTSRTVLPWLVRRHRPKTLLLGSLFGSATAFSAMPLTLDWPWAVVLLTTVGGFALGIGQPITMSMISTTVPLERRGQALALRLMSSRLGQVIIPAGAGGIAAALGPAAALQLACLVLITALGPAARRAG